MIKFLVKECNSNVNGKSLVVNPRHRIDVCVTGLACLQCS